MLRYDFFSESPFVSHLRRRREDREGGRLAAVLIPHFDPGWRPRQYRAAMPKRRRG